MHLIGLQYVKHKAFEDTAARKVEGASTEVLQLWDAAGVNFWARVAVLRVHLIVVSSLLSPGWAKQVSTVGT